MNTELKLGCLIAVIKLLITLPMAYILEFLTLKHIDATETMWLLFWIGTPLSFFLMLLMEIVGIMVKKED